MWAWTVGGRRSGSVFKRENRLFVWGGGGQIRSLRLVASMANMTIKQRTEGFGLKWLGDGLAPTLFEGIWDIFFVKGGVGNTNHFAFGRSN